MTKTIERYENVIHASATNRERETHHLVVVGVNRLTESLRLRIAEQLWKQQGGDMETWNRVDDRERQRWARLHMGRYSYMEVTTYDDGYISYETNSGGGGHRDGDFVVIEKGEL